jgi:hypothetical protein
MIMNTWYGKIMRKPKTTNFYVVVINVSFIFLMPWQTKRKTSGCWEINRYFLRMHKNFNYRRYFYCKENLAELPGYYHDSFVIVCKWKGAVIFKTVNVNINANLLATCLCNKAS